MVGKKGGTKSKKRVCLDVEAHILAMGDDYFHCKYQMGKEFFCLLDMLDPFLPNVGKADCWDKISYGVIIKMSWPGMALHFLAGGDPLDIDDHHGVCRGQPLICVGELLMQSTNALKWIFLSHLLMWIKSLLPRALSQSLKLILIVVLELSMEY